MPSTNPESQGGEPAGRRSSRFVSLRARMLMLVLLAFLPLFLLTLYEGLEQRQQALMRAQENALSVARMAASNQARMIEGTRQLLMATTQIRPVRFPTPGTCSQAMAALLTLNPLYSNLAALTPDGEVFCSALPLTENVNYSDLPFFQEVLRVKDFVFASYITPRIAGKPGIAVLYPALDAEGQVQTVVFAGIDLDWLDGFVATAQLPEGSTLTLVDASGTIVTRYPDPERWRGQNLPTSLLEPLLEQGEGLTEQVGLDGVRRLYAFTSFCCAGSGDLILRIGIPTSIAFADANNLMIRNLITLVAVTLLALGIAWVGARFLVLEPVQVLLGAIKRYDAGDFSARTGLGADVGEFGSVGNALDTMASTLQARLKERDRSAEELRREVARSEAMALIAKRLNTQLGLEDVLGTVCQEAARALSAQAASVYLLDGEQNRLSRVVCSGLPEDCYETIQMTLQSLLETPEWPHGVVVTHVCTTPDLAYGQLLCEWDIRGLAGVPLLHEGQILGALFVFALGEEQVFLKDDIDFLRAISDEATAAVLNARLYESLRREERARANLLHALISAQEDERKRIARELHDETSQDVSSLIVGIDAVSMALEGRVLAASQHLYAAKRVVKDMLKWAQLSAAGLQTVVNPRQGGLNPQDGDRQRLNEISRELDSMDRALMGTIRDTNDGLQNAKSIAEGILEGTRRLVYDLRPSLLDDLGLEPAIASYCASRLGPLGIALDLQYAVQESRLSPALETMLFRIAQEAINNIVRHSGATRTLVQLGTSGSDVVMRVEDNGHGFVLDDQPGEPCSGLGLKGMRERVDMLGGRLNIQTGMGRGTVIEVRTPLVNQEAANE
jgi:signal transduction histidine kinase